MEEKFIVEGRKAFFIAPDITILPESYLEDFLVRGYETYIIDDFRFCPLEGKVDIIVGNFPNSILFFFVDSDAGVDWERYIARLQNDYDGKLLIGILYTKRSSEEKQRAIEKYYLYDLGVQCGCIALEYQKSKNFNLIDRVLHANQACGRRKNVRAICDMASKANFDYERERVGGRIADISLSHFSFFPESGRSFPDIPQNEQIKDIFMIFNGLHFKANARLIVKREIDGRILHVFLFEKQDGTLGLEDYLVSQLSQKIYKAVADRVKTFLREKFDEYAKTVKKIGQKKKALQNKKS